jgi:DNA-binding IclR family transcriptional regulator
MTAQPNQSVGHALSCLVALTDAGEPVGSREVARRLGMEHTRVNRLLGTLATLGLAERDAKRKYRAGPGIHALAAGALRGSGLLQAALPEIRALHAAGFGVALGLLWLGRVVYLYHGRPQVPLEDNLASHASWDPELSSIGQVLSRGLDHAAITGSLAVPIGAPPVAGLALLGGTDRDLETLHAAAGRIATRLAQPAAP